MAAGLEFRHIHQTTQQDTHRANIIFAVVVFGLTLAAIGGYALWRKGPDLRKFGERKPAAVAPAARQAAAPGKAQSAKPAVVATARSVYDECKRIGRVTVAGEMAQMVMLRASLEELRDYKESLNEMLEKSCREKQQNFKASP